MIILGLALFIYYDMRANVKMEERTALIVTGGVFILTSLLAFWLQNKSDHVAFLIDTDSEMKKVNWIRLCLESQ